MVLALMLLADIWANAASPEPMSPPAAIITPAANVPRPWPPMPDTLPRGPAPTEMVQSWVITPDYPPEAMRKGEAGITSFTLAVDSKGVITGCAVTASSGSALLDKVTCEAASRRAHFSPALDEKGKPVRGTYSEKVRWALPQPSTLPQVGAYAVSFVVEGDGHVTACDLQRAEGVMALRRNNPCPWRVREGYKDEHGNPVRRKVTVMQTVTVDPAE